MLSGLVNRVGRTLMAAIFVKGGLDAALAPGPRVLAAEKIGLPNPENMVRANGAAMMLGGLALATGRLPRLAALGLVASLAPTTYAGHAFWAESDKATRAQQQTQFLKNLSLIGGLLVVAAGRTKRGKAAPRS